MSLTTLLAAIDFAAARHAGQRRKGADAAPYINHPIAVTCLLANVGDITDAVTLMAAALHDTIEDTPTTGDELEALFGLDVRRVVEEVTDDTSLPKEERKRLQVVHAPTLSARAKAVKLGDKIANLRDVTDNPPPDWSLDRRAEYLDWTAEVIAGCRGTNAALEALYDEVLADGRRKLGR